MEKKNSEEEAQNAIISQYPKAPKLDLSKIANMKAVEKEDRDGADMIASKIVTSPHKAAKRKFNFIEPQEIYLPSKGKFYQDSNDADLRKGIIKMYPMSVSEEEILTNQAYAKSGRIFEILFDACMASDYDANKILNFDSMYLLYYLRKISYGDDYEFSIKCTDCGKDFKYKLNISDVEWEELSDDVQETYTLKLPISKYTVTLKMPRIKDENECTRLKNNNRDNTPEKVFQLYAYTTEILNSDNEILDQSDWKDFYKVLPGLDRSEIAKLPIWKIPYPEVNVTCPKCGNSWNLQLPLEPDFFRLS